MRRRIRHLVLVALSALLPCMAPAFQVPATAPEFLPQLAHDQQTTYDSLDSIVGPKGGAVRRPIDVHQETVADLLKQGGTDLGLYNPIADVRGAGKEWISVRTVNLSRSTYTRPVALGRVPPLTSTLVSKAYKLTNLAEVGPKIMHVALYGSRPTAAQLTALRLAQTRASRFGVKLRWEIR